MLIYDTTRIYSDYPTQPRPARTTASPSSPITIAHSKFTEPSFCSDKYFHLQTIETSQNIVVLKHFDLAATADPQRQSSLDSPPEECQKDLLGGLFEQLADETVVLGGGDP